ncbi:MAG: TonB family protein [Sphingomicrobium sp.]
MLAYAPRRDAQRLSPTALALIIAGHLAAIAAVMSAKMVIERHADPPIIVESIRAPEPPKPVDPPPLPDSKPAQSKLENPMPILPSLPRPGPAMDPNPQPMPQPGPTIVPAPVSTPIPFHAPIVRTGPRFATAANDVRPPYPDSKRESGDEASLRLKLTIDEGGRVVAVEPVGKVDRTFFEAARRHILRAWRYQPAMEGSKAVPSSTTITLKFELGNA